jgi:phytoene dehydrogenase-like protein
MYDVIIIGSGCAGLTAAIYAARANLKLMVIDGQEPGGQLSLTTMVENFPGFPEGILGPELIENMRKQAKKFGTEFKAGVVNEVDLTKRPFKVIAGKDTRNQDHYRGFGRLRAHFGSGVRTQAARLRRFHLRHLRRLFLPQQAHRRGWRRRLGDGGSQFPDALRQQGVLDSPPQRFPRLENHDRPRSRQRKNRIRHAGDR